MIKAMIVDDEKYIREELIYSLKRYDDVEVCCQTGEAEEVIDLIKEYEPDVIFLDIHLHTDNGLSLALDIKQLKKSPHLVLATAYSEYALEGFDVGAVDYLVKPFDKSRMNQCIDRIRALISNDLSQKNRESATSNPKKIALQKNDKFYLVDLTDIIYLEFINKNVHLHTSEDDYISNNLSLKKFIEVYGNYNFIRIHKSFIVNIEYISEIIPWFNSTMKIILRNNQSKEIFVSRNYIKEFKNIVKL